MLFRHLRGTDHLLIVLSACVWSVNLAVGSGAPHNKSKSSHKPFRRYMQSLEDTRLLPFGGGRWGSNQGSLGPACAAAILGKPALGAPQLPGTWRFVYTFVHTFPLSSQYPGW